jgi:hypothetical protein
MTTKGSIAAPNGPQDSGGHPHARKARNPSNDGKPSDGLEPSTLTKNWPQYELDGLVARDMYDGGRRLLPVWHNIAKDEPIRQSPSLVDRVALSTGALTVEEMADQIAEVCAQNGRHHGRPHRGDGGLCEVPRCAAAQSGIRVIPRPIPCSRRRRCKVRRLRHRVLRLQAVHRGPCRRGCLTERFHHSAPNSASVSLPASSAASSPVRRFAAQLGVEGLGVALAAEDLRAVLAGLPPAHAPDDAAVHGSILSMLTVSPLDGRGATGGCRRLAEVHAGMSRAGARRRGRRSARPTRRTRPAGSAASSRAARRAARRARSRSRSPSSTAA